MLASDPKLQHHVELVVAALFLHSANRVVQSDLLCLWINGWVQLDAAAPDTFFFVSMLKLEKLNFTN
jgi:hypothetical protein